jgi:TonB family protein
VRALLGAQVAYAAWALVPLTLLAVLLPARTAGTRLVFPIDEVNVLTALPNAAATHAPPALLPLLLLAWLLGALAVGAVLASRQRQFQTRIRRQPGQDHDASEWATPAVTGLFRPRIVLPSDFRQRYTVNEQRLVLAHEQLHVKRGDIPAQALATLLRCLFWFHPLVHLAATRFRFDQELACDAAVVRRFPDSRRTYGDAMLKTQLAEFGLPLGCHWQSQHPLKERIAMLKQPLPGLVRRCAGSILIGSLLAAATLASWAAQPAAQSAAPVAVPHLQALTDDDVLGNPKYPAQAIKDGISGLVMLELLVGVDGKPREIKIVDSEPAGVFDRFAVEAAEQWRFNAGRNGARGEKVEGWVRVPIKFTADAPPEGTEVE